MNYEIIGYLIYGLFALLTIGTALGVVLSKHTVYAALNLVMTMISIAGIFIMINAQVAAVLQIMIYAGAIMVLFIFVIMLLNLGKWPEPTEMNKRFRRIGGALFLVLALQFGALAFMFASRSGYAINPETSPQVSEVALTLMTRYIYAFEMTSVMLLIAVVGSMVLGRRSLGRSSANAGFREADRDPHQRQIEI